ncbi:MAG TPA: hypothetical protein VGS17_06910 [Candidatus Limnocylindria bacterium]|nr:hypothetical protein [Candidatus Limnocylindria bacterium]
MKLVVATCLVLLVACAPSGNATPSPTRSPEWSIHDAAGLRIEAPAVWIGPEVLTATDSTGAPPAWVVYRDASGAEVLALMTWRDATASSIAATQFQSEFPRGAAPQQLTVVEGTRARTVVATTGYAQWSDASGAGTYECRHLFVQVDPRLVADVIACGAHIKGNATPTPELRNVQEQVALRLSVAGGQP